MSRRKIKWPNNKAFAFTIVDDTDNSTLDIIKPIYDYLLECNILTTKTTWVYPSNNKYYGDTLQDEPYKNYLLFLKSNGFEIGLHNVGSGLFKRDQIINGLNEFRNIFGAYPSIQINHSNNEDNIYWGPERFSGLVKFLYKLRRKTSIKSLGSIENSECFWGDYCKENIKYIRNRTFSSLNTLKKDRYLVSKEYGKETFSNYWFSSSNALDCKRFKKIMTKKNIDKLERNGGCCILYTHFAYGFLDNNGCLDDEVKNILKYISEKNGWFAPASEILDFVVEDNNKRCLVPTKAYFSLQDIKWLFERVFK